MKDQVSAFDVMKEHFPEFAKEFVHGSDDHIFEHWAKGARKQDIERIVDFLGDLWTVHRAGGLTPPHLLAQVLLFGLWLSATGRLEWRPETEREGQGMTGAIPRVKR